jgi:hypothetical protein
MHANASTTAKTIGAILTGGLIILGVVIGLGRSAMMGKPYKANDKQTVHYSGAATEQEAKSLAAALALDGYFDGQTEIDVLLRKGEEGTIISFVTTPVAWTDPSMPEQFKDIADRCSYAIGGLPITVRLIDERLNTKKEMKLEFSRWGTPLAITSHEKIYRQGSATEAESRAVGEALQKIGFLSGTKAVDVFINKSPESTTISFVTSEAAWNNPAIEAEFRGIGETLGPLVGGKPIKVLLIDDKLVTKKEIEVK